MSETESSLDTLRRRAEVALERESTRVDAERILEQMVNLAMPGSEPSVFAHRRLAESRVERSPWHAALHLRHVLKAHPDDDMPHALMGLCQALLGNHRVAVASYRRAVRIAPDVPWYRHNLGHLLDVGLDEPQGALRHLDAACRLEPEHPEILGSYAHCLARTGKLERARELAEQAISIEPDNGSHRRLLVWIEAGAPEDFEVPGDSLEQLADEQRVTNEIHQCISERLTAAEFSPAEVRRAIEMWVEFDDARSPNVRKPAVAAAAIEYAMALVVGRKGTTHKKLAARYGVSPASVRTRFVELRDALGLRPHDPRYQA